MLRCGRNHFERIDASGAWMVVHFVTLIGNVAFLIFSLWPYGDLMKGSSTMKKSIEGWKIFYVFVEVVGEFYCYYIVHNPVVFLETERERNARIEQEINTRANGRENISMTTNPSTQQQNLQPVAYHSEDVQHAGYQRRQPQQNGNDRPPPPYTANPSFEGDFDQPRLNNVRYVRERQKTTMAGIAMEVNAIHHRYGATSST